MKFVNNEIAEAYETLMNTSIREMFDEFFAQHIELKQEDMDFIMTGFKVKLKQVLGATTSRMERIGKPESAITRHTPWVADMLGDIRYEKPELEAFLADFPKKLYDKSPTTLGFNGLFSYRPPTYRKDRLTKKDAQKSSFNRMLAYVPFRDYTTLHDMPLFYGSGVEKKTQNLEANCRPYTFSRKIGQKIHQTAKDNLNEDQYGTFMHISAALINIDSLTPLAEKQEDMDWASYFTKYLLETRQVQSLNPFEKIKLKYYSLAS